MRFAVQTKNHGYMIDTVRFMCYDFNVMFVAHHATTARNWVKYLSSDRSPVMASLSI